MAYRTLSTCPTTHPVALPELDMEVSWPGDGRQHSYTLSSGNTAGLNAGFMNGRDQRALGRTGAARGTASSSSRGARSISWPSTSKHSWIQASAASRTLPGCRVAMGGMANADRLMSETDRSRMVHPPTRRPALMPGPTNSAP